MTQFTLAARSQIRNVLLCTLATLTLAACGSESDPSSAAATSAEADTTAAVDTAVSLVSKSTGTIDRSATPDSNTTASSSTSSRMTIASVPSPSSSASSSTSNSTTTSGTPTAVATSGVVTLDWMPPTENADGSVLTNLAGYRIYYGSSPDNLTHRITVTNPGLASYTVSNLSSGTWYFAMAAYSRTRVESPRTSTVSIKL